jgi:hypothetical protein
MRCSMHARDKKCKLLVKKLKARDHLGDLDADRG